jgi:predicted GIY-YIG superfamily endonuclease
MESFFQLVEQQKLLWAFCHGSTTQAIKNLESFFQLVEQQKLLWTFSLGTTAQAIRKFGKLFINLWNNKKFSGQFVRSTAKTTQNLKSFFQLVEQQKLLWAFCHGSTTQAIKKLGKLLPTYGTTTNSLGIFSQINSRNNTKYGKIFPTCGTTKTSLDILS